MSGDVSPQTVHQDVRDANQALNDTIDSHGDCINKYYALYDRFVTCHGLLPLGRIHQVLRQDAVFIIDGWISANINQDINLRSAIASLLSPPNARNQRADSCAWLSVTKLDLVGLFRLGHGGLTREFVNNLIKAQKSGYNLDQFLPALLDIARTRRERGVRSGRQPLRFKPSDCTAAAEGLPAPGLLNNDQTAALREDLPDKDEDVEASDGIGLAVGAGSRESAQEHEDHNGTGLAVGAGSRASGQEDEDHNGTGLAVGAGSRASGQEHEDHNGTGLAVGAGSRASAQEHEDHNGTGLAVRAGSRAFEQVKEVSGQSLGPEHAGTNTPEFLIARSGAKTVARSQSAQLPDQDSTVDYGDHDGGFQNQKSGSNDGNDSDNPVDYFQDGNDSDSECDIERGRHAPPGLQDDHSSSPSVSRKRKHLGDSDAGSTDARSSKRSRSFSPEFVVVEDPHPKTVEHSFSLGKSLLNDKQKSSALSVHIPTPTDSRDSPHHDKSILPKQLAADAPSLKADLSSLEDSPSTQVQLGYEYAVQNLLSAKEIKSSTIDLLLPLFVPTDWHIADCASSKESYLKDARGYKPLAKYEPTALPNILLPMCDGAHWALVVLYPTRSRFAVVDSLRDAGYRSSQWQSRARSFCQLLDDRTEPKHRERDARTKTWQCEIDKGCLQQDDSINCGIFVILNAILCTTGAIPSAGIQIDPAVVRSVFATVLAAKHRGLQMPPLAVPNIHLPFVPHPPSVSEPLSLPYIAECIKNFRRLAKERRVALSGHCKDLRRQRPTYDLLEEIFRSRQLSTGSDRTVELGETAARLGEFSGGAMAALIGLELGSGWQERMRSIQRRAEEQSQRERADGEFFAMALGLLQQMRSNLDRSMEESRRELALDGLCDDSEEV